MENGDIRILYVADDEDVRTSYKNVLQLAGYKVTVVGSIEEAQGLQIKDFNIIISDYLFSGGIKEDGLKFLSALRKAAIETPFVFCTGSSPKELQAKVSDPALYWIDKIKGGDFLEQFGKILEIALGSVKAAAKNSFAPPPPCQ